MYLRIFVDFRREMVYQDNRKGEVPVQAPVDLAIKTQRPVASGTGPAPLTSE